MRRTRRVIHLRGSITSIDRVRIGEILVHRHGLVRPRSHNGQLDLGAEGWGTRCQGIHFPVIMHVTESWLVRREGPAVGVWMRSSIDDVGGVAVEGVGWRVEGVTEVV